MYDNPVAPAAVETAATIDSKGKAALAQKYSFWQTSCRQQHQLEHCPWSLTRKLFKAS